MELGKLQNGERLVYRSPEGVQYNPDASYQKALEIGDNGNKEMTYLLHPKTFSGRTYELKEKLVQKVLEMHPTCADAWMLLPEMGKQPYDRRDRPQESLVAILRYVDLRPDDLIAWETLFAVKRAMKDDEKAIMGENLPPLEADLHRHATQRRAAGYLNF